MLRRILVPLDGSAFAEEAIGMAASIARASHAQVDLLMVHEPILTGRTDDFTWTEKQIVAEQHYLRQIASELSSGAGITSQQTLLRGQPAELITVRATDCDADLIVMTSHGRTGLSRAWIGSVADSVVRSSNVPVLMIRPDERHRDRRRARQPVSRILIPLDGSAIAMEILGPACDLARAWNAPVDLVRVVAPVPLMTPDMGMPFVYLAGITDSELTELVVKEATAELKRDADRLIRDGISVGKQTVVVSPQTAQAIVDCARANESGLIAMTSHGRGVSRLLLGSVVDKVRRSADAPVLVQRPRHVRVAPPVMTTEAIASDLPALAGATGGDAP